jgi:hypothetical protein
MAKNRAGLVELPAEEPSPEAWQQALAAVTPVHAPHGTPGRRYHVRLKHSPDAVVTAQHPGEAQAKYMARMSLRQTVHPFTITEIDETGQPLAPEPEQPAVAQPAPALVVIH